MKALAVALGVILASVLLGCGGKDAPLRGATFESAAWKAADSHSGVRARMLGDYIDRIGIVGRTRREIEADLGPPDHESWGKVMPYPGWTIGTYDGFEAGTPFGVVVSFDESSKAVGYFTPFREGGRFDRRSVK